MGSFSPLQIALLIVAGLSLVGVIVTFIGTERTFSGYGGIVNDVRRLGLTLHAQVFRDRSDVVVSGTYETIPVVLRFSNEENTPGVNIRLQAPAMFGLSVVPASAKVTEGGRVMVKTTNQIFDVRFSTRTDQPMQAKMFITAQVTALLQRLACSRNTYLSLGNGAIELSELTIPEPDTAKHVLEHLDAMAKLGEALRRMPGSDRVKLVTLKPERHIAARVAMAVGAVVAGLSLFAAMKAPSRPPNSGVNATLAAGIMPMDAANISNLKDWRVATANDLDPVAVAWLRNNRKQPNNRIEGDFSGKGTGRDVVYLLIAPHGTRRVVLLAGNENRYDTKFPYIGLAARVPKGMVNSIAWVGGKPPEGVDGDGVLLVRKPDDPASAIVLFLSGRGIVSASPVNYQDISLE